MATNYREGTFDSTPEVFAKPVRYVHSMDMLSAGYIGREQSFWFKLIEKEGAEEAEIQSVVDTADLCYLEGSLSPQAIPDDWLRIIRIPPGLIVDLSHIEDLKDEDGKFIAPIDWYREAEDAKKPEHTCGMIENTMQLAAVEQMLRNLYQFELGKSFLHILLENEKMLDDIPDEE